jgi:hypothetical protein
MGLIGPVNVFFNFPFVACPSRTGDPTPKFLAIGDPFILYGVPMFLFLIIQMF